MKSMGPDQSDDPGDPADKDRKKTPPDAIHVLVNAVRDLSLSKDLDSIMKVVRSAARKLVGADGATFVLRDGDNCHYAEEDAISPLWKGHRFPMESCISGWAMLNKKAVAIPDIYKDPRIPALAYRPTFVKSLVMVPIRITDPLGAIGTYWSEIRQASSNEVELLQALADSASVAMENLQANQQMEAKIAERTSELKRLNEELEAFSASASHDLRNPLATIQGYLDVIETAGHAPSVPFYPQIKRASDRMGTLLQNFLELAKVQHCRLQKVEISLTDLAKEICDEMLEKEKGRQVDIQIQSGISAVGDPAMLRIALENLFSNALKYTRKRRNTEISLGSFFSNAALTYYISDNGIGFDMKETDRLFGTFERLHSAQDFEGTGLGLSTVHRIILRHSGKIWAESQLDRGTTFFFTLPD